MGLMVSEAVIRRFSFFKCFTGSKDAIGGCQLLTCALRRYYMYIHTDYEIRTVNARGRLGYIRFVWAGPSQLSLLHQVVSRTVARICICIHIHSARAVAGFMGSFDYLQVYLAV